MIENTYSDSLCLDLVNSTNYTDMGTAGMYQSWDCSGSNNYAEASVYISSTCTTALVSVFYATDVCFISYDGNSHAKTTCYNQTSTTNMTATIGSYAKTDTTCTGTQNASASITIKNTCSLIGKYEAGTVSVYSIVEECKSGDVYTGSSSIAFGIFPGVPLIAAVVAVVLRLM